jgi:hypothetical protein
VNTVNKVEDESHKLFKMKAAKEASPWQLHTLLLPAVSGVTLKNRLK